MRLLHVDTKEIHEFQAAPYPPYAILSHTWGDDGDEVTFQEMVNLPTSPSVRQKPGYRKIEQCCARASADEIEYVWIDTCCIDKTSSAELSEAINSMYGWYEGARICYAWLRDVPTAAIGQSGDPENLIKGSRWFTRGWTLQELVAPAVVEFYAADWTEIGTKWSLAADLASITGIGQDILAGKRPVLSCNVAERMSWAADRSTKRAEDAAYSLLGLFGVAMPLIYGEGRSRSFGRLQEEIMRTREDYTMLVWDIVPKREPPPGGSRGGLIEEGRQKQQKLTVPLPKTTLSEAKAMGPDMNDGFVRWRAPLADSPAGFRISKADWRDWRYSHLKFYVAGNEVPKSTRKDWLTLETLAPDYSPPQMTARGLRIWLSLHHCSTNIVLAYLNCTLHGLLVCTFLRRVREPGTNIYERVVPDQGAYCFLPNGSTDSFRTELVYLAAPVTRRANGSLLPLPLLDSRPQVEVQICGSSKIGLCASGWDPTQDHVGGNHQGFVEKTTISRKDKNGTPSFCATAIADFSKDIPCVRAVYDNRHPFMVVFDLEWCRVLFFSQDALYREQLLSVERGSQFLTDMADNAVLRLLTDDCCTLFLPGLWDAQGQVQWDFKALGDLRDIASKLSVALCPLARFDRIVCDSGHGFAVAVAYKRLGDRSVIRVTVSESSSPESG